MTERTSKKASPKGPKGVYDILVDRLWVLYAWPEWNLPKRLLTVENVLRYRSQPTYVSDDLRTWRQPKRSWDLGRIRFFYEKFLAGEDEDPIEIDNVCDGAKIYPEPVLNDGHHRLAGAFLARRRTLRATYGGRVDLLRYLTGKRKTRPRP